VTNFSQHDLPPPLPRQKPSGGVVALGVISIIYSIFFYLCGGIVSVATPFFSSALQQFAEKQGINNFAISPAMQAYSLINGVIIIVLGTLLIIGGIGLLGLRRWGRNLSISAATALIVWLLIAFVIDIFFYYPSQNQMLQEQLGQFSEGQQMVVMVVSRIFGIFFQLAYPVILLVCLHLRSIKTQFETEMNSPS
jgi:hypothetical protein